MNWTEGTLNRHSRGRKSKETILRQKEHFAKARSGLLNANVKNSPPSISFLAHSGLTSSLVRHASSKPAQSPPKKHNDTLESSRHFSGVHADSSNPSPSRRHQTDDQALRQKRHELLFKGDWVGTGAQKPIEMKFSGPRASPSRAWGARLARHESSRNKLRQLLGVKHDNRRSKAAQGGVHASTPISLRNMRIRVGSRQRTLGGSSNISRSYRGDDSVSQGKYDLGYHGHRGEPKAQEYAFNPGSDARTYLLSNELETDKMRTSPLMFHPIPTRMALLQHLPSYSDDEDNADSTAAQVGFQCPFIPSAEAEENEAWRDFVAGSHEFLSSNDFSNFGDEEMPLDGMVSPGVSQRSQALFSRDTDQEEAPTRIPVGESNVVDEDLEEAPSTHSILTVLRPEQPGIVASRTPSDDGHVIPATEDPDPGFPDITLAHIAESPQANGRKSQGSSPFSERSDEVSLLVVSTSPSHSSSPPNVSYSDTLLKMLRKANPEETGFEATTQNPQSLEQQEPEEDLREKRMPHAVQEPRQGTPEDENDIWRKFVFGGSGDNFEQVREDARKETARNLRPSITPSSTGDEVREPHTCSYENLNRDAMSSSSGPGFRIDRHVSQDPQHLATEISTTASASHVATTGASSPVLTSELQCSETTMQTDHATAGSVDSSPLAPTGATDSLISPEVIGTPCTEMDHTPLIIQPNQSEKQGDVNEVFRFARPKLFMGKKLGPVDERRHIALSTAQIRGKKQVRGRPTRKRDGRANIKKLPNYGSDPIEEFEDDARSDRAQQGSIFGSLETEESF